MRRTANILLYITIGLIIAGTVFPATNLTTRGLKALFALLGYWGIFLYFSIKCFRDLRRGKDRILFLLNLFIALTSVCLFAKYFGMKFSDYPTLLLIPLFLVFSVIYFIKRWKYSWRINAVIILYIILSIPLFGLKLPNRPRQFIPGDWLTRYDIARSYVADFSYDFKFTETKELTKMGDKLKKSHKYHQAIEQYDRALLIEPSNPEILFKLAEVYSITDKLELAIKLLNTAIDLDKQNPYFYNNRGILYYKLIENDKAIADYKMAISIDSTLSQSYANLALVYYYEHLFEESCYSLSKAETLGHELNRQNYLKQIKRKHCR